MVFCIAVSLISFTSVNPPKPKKQPQQSQTGWVNLLDKDLSAWNNYLSYSLKADFNGKRPVNDKGEELAPAGYNKNTNNVFSVIQQDGESVLKISGELYGCVFTKQEFENFHLKLKTRWGTQMYGPRIGKLKDSGILYFSQGEAGIDHWKSWMLSQEFQIMQGHIGDYWCIGSSAIDIRAYLAEGKMNSIADTGQPFLSFGPGSEGVCQKSGNYENPEGQWNTVELICYQGKSIHIVNGHVVMVLKNSRYIDNGKTIPLTKGKIQLQSEGCEVYYKGIEIKTITDLPEQYKAYYN